MSPDTVGHGIQITNVVRRTNARIAAWWYGRIVQNTKERSQPKIEVLFREVDEKGKLSSSNYLIHPVNIALLGQVPLGSVWREGKKVGSIPLERRRFKVDFSTDGYVMSRALDAEESGRYLIPPFSHLLLNGPDTHIVNSYVINFRLAYGHSLVVPSIEYFLRTYGLSGEIHRVLVTYPWYEVRKRLFADSQPKNLETDNGHWVIHPGPYMQLDDVLFLAHLLHDWEVRRCAKLLWSQVVANESHLHIIPWHKNTGLIEVLGKKLPDNSFLGLRITGFEPPETPPIDVVWHRKKNATKDGLNIEESPIPVPRKTFPDQEMPLSNDEPPDHGKGYAETWEAPVFQFLVSRPKIYSKPHEKLEIQNRSVNRLDGADRLSAGDAAGTPKGVGKVVARTPAMLESKGTLRDMWEIFKELQHQQPSRILEVGWLNWQGRITGDKSPELCPFPSQMKGVKTPSWLYLNKETGERRGLLMIWVKTNVCPVIVMEIQRRTVLEGADRREIESFKGLSVRVGREPSVVLHWMRTISSKAAENRGVFPRTVIQTCPTIADTFKHVHAKGTAFRENTAWLALAKVGCLEKVK